MADHKQGSVDPELSNFLQKVDDVGSLIKDLACEEDSKRDSALQKADEYLTKNETESSGFNASSINKYEEKKEDIGYNQSSISPEQFMKDVEKDAEYRKQKRKENAKKADSLKQVGNTHFKREEFNDAVTYYSEAIKLVPDSAVLYTNRAQARGRLDQYELALQDCETALQLDKYYIKAHIHKGKALQKLYRFDEAYHSFQQAGKVDKKEMKTVAKYLRELEQEQSKFKQESEAALAEKADIGHGILKKTIDRLRRSASDVEECIKLLSQIKVLLDQEMKRVSFRKFGGFKIFAENSTISRAWKSVPKEIQEGRLLKEAISVLVRATIENDINVVELCETNLLTSIVHFLSNNCDEDLRKSASTLLFRISQVEEGRSALVNHSESNRIVDLLLPMLTLGEDVAHTALRIINNLALEERFAEPNGPKLVENLIPSLLTMTELFLLPPDSNSMQPSFLDSIITTFSMLSNLAKTTSVRMGLAANEIYWKLNNKILTRYRKETDTSSTNIIFSVLGLLSNVSTGTKMREDDMLGALDSFPDLLRIDNKGVIERASYILNRFITATDGTKDRLTKKPFLQAYVNILQTSTDTAKGYITKCLAVSANESKDCRLMLCNQSDVDALLNLLNGKHWQAVGNTALCIAGCLQEDEFVNLLNDTNVVQDLLKIASNNEIDKDVRHNAGIAIGKLVAADSKHLQTIRDLHGFEILHEVLRNVKT